MALCLLKTKTKQNKKQNKKQKNKAILEPHILPFMAVPLGALEYEIDAHVPTEEPK